MRVDRENIPDSYLCEVCQPRHVDKHRAIQIQTRKRDDLCELLQNKSMSFSDQLQTYSTYFFIGVKPIRQ